MEGRGRYLNNIFIERQWRSQKQEAVHLHELQNGFQAKRIIKDWISFYNTKRPTRQSTNDLPTTHSSTQNEP
jgi:putative transposase